MLDLLLLERCSTVYKIDYSDVMEKPEAPPNRTLLNYKHSQVSHCDCLHHSGFPEARSEMYLHRPLDGVHLET
jgi:hypothetical protein